MIAQAFITDRVCAGLVFGNFHFPGLQNVNNLTIAALDPVSKIPEYKVCAVRLEPISNIASSWIPGGPSSQVESREFG